MEDLKHLNILVQKDKLWVIDWGEQFFTGPPLFESAVFPVLAYQEFHSLKLSSTGL